MGRELKRVPLDFAAPLDVIWPGYLRPAGTDCPVCEGEGATPDGETCAECKGWGTSWRRTDPPEGPGYQMWETTTEGSPQSPVFETLDALAEWCAENATTFADFRATAEEWRNMLDHDNVHHCEGAFVFI